MPADVLPLLYTLPDYEPTYFGDSDAGYVDSLVVLRKPLAG